MTDIVAFLTARLDEDERIASAVCVAGVRWAKDDTLSGELVIRSDDVLFYESPRYRAEGEADHIIRHDPARVLREVAAKRRVLARHRLERGGSAVWCAGCGESDGGYPRSMGADGCPELRDMASIYADRPGYKDEWRVGP